MITAGCGREMGSYWCTINIDAYNRAGIVLSWSQNIQSPIGAAEFALTWDHSTPRTCTYVNEVLNHRETTSNGTMMRSGIDIETICSYISVETVDLFLFFYTYLWGEPDGLLTIRGNAPSASVWFTFARTVGALQGRGEGLAQTRRSRQSV